MAPVWPEYTVSQSVSNIMCVYMCVYMCVCTGGEYSKSLGNERNENA